MGAEKRGYNPNKHNYNYDLKNYKDRGKFVEEKLSFINDLSADEKLGYTSDTRSKKNKTNYIPSLIDKYTEYYLDSRDIVKDGEKREFQPSLNYHKRLKLYSENMFYFNKMRAYDYFFKNFTEDDYIDNGLDNISDDVLYYAIKYNKLDKKQYRTFMSNAVDVIVRTESLDLKYLIQEKIKKHYEKANSELEKSIYLDFINGISLREMSKTYAISYRQVRKIIDKILF